MSWSRRHLLLAGLAAGCGFAPAYGPRGQAAMLRSAIAVADPTSPAGFALVQQIERRLGRAVAPRYDLTFEIGIDTDVVRMTRDEIAARYNLVGTVAYRVSERAGGQIVRAGEVSSFTGYSAGAATVAERSAARDAQERLMVLLADQLVAELLATAGDWAA